MTRFLSTARSARQTITVALLLILLAILIYSNALDAPFVFDDLPNITKSPHIRMTEITPDSIISGTKGPSPFRPTAYLSFAVNYYFNQYNTRGYHLINLGIHAATAMLMFLVAGHTLRLARIARGIIPEITALVWLIHPLHIQSVTYTVQRINSLATLFFMLSLYLYIRARQTRQNHHPGKLNVWLFFSGCALSGLLALFSKEIAATLPICIFLYEWIFFQNLNQSWLSKQIKGIVLVLALVLIVAILYLKADPMDRILSSYSRKSFTLAQRLLTEPQVVIYYLSLLFFPHPARLNIDYDFPLSASLADLTITTLSLMAVVALLTAAFYRPKRHKLLSFTILWFLGNLVIESSVIGLAIIFEHRTYLPSLFPALVVTTFLVRHLPRPVSIFCLGLTIITCCAWTYQRNAVWSDSLLLWQDSAGKSPRKARPANGVGVGYQARNQSEKALDWFQKAIRLDPDHDEAYSNIGVILANQGQPDKAVSYLKRAIALAPESFEIYSNLGSALHRLHQYDDAIACFTKSINIYPDYEAAHSNLAAALTQKGDLEGAMRHLNQAIRINPEYPDAHNNMGLVMMQLGRMDDAIACYQHALKLKPENATAHFNLGTAWFQKQDLDRARHHLQQAARIDPHHGLAFNNLIAVLVLQKKYQAAVKALKHLTNLSPESPTVFYNLACVYALQDKKEAAVSALQKALDNGYDRWHHLETDPDLKNIYDTAYFKRLVQSKSVNRK